MAITLVLPACLPQVLFVLSILCAYCFIAGFAIILPKRIKIFNKDFLKQFAKEHAAAFPGRDVTRMGFPDAGNGRFA